MGEFNFNITENTIHRPEPIQETAGFAAWFDQATTNPEERLEEAVELGYIEDAYDMDVTFMDTVLTEARRMNHGPSWIKEIMDYEREHDMIHISIIEDDTDENTTEEQLIEAFQMHIGIIDWFVGMKGGKPISEEIIKESNRLMDEIFKEKEEKK